MCAGIRRIVVSVGVRVRGVHWVFAESLSGRVTGRVYRVLGSGARFKVQVLVDLVGGEGLILVVSLS